VHRSLDRTKVINYAQWESQEAFDAMRRNTEAAGHLRELGQIGTPAPVVCEVVSGYHV
jgi:heme-degrading monooxygenase HmoA